ncbi:hypothetical protein N0V83_005314 [Neocucurbitaria cava]|uniref:Uncharacterized protein n=1 Tax=Neocucurbitaria cava TaxID=798079 RepID=A0A9W8Y8W4_9PLEO|nr:hypothetical protein N0V83_005314 [Neocucurbitaria cava]
MDARVLDATGHHDVYELSVPVSKSPLVRTWLMRAAEGDGEAETVEDADVNEPNDMTSDDSALGDREVLLSVGGTTDADDGVLDCCVNEELAAVEADEDGIGLEDDNPMVDKSLEEPTVEAPLAADIVLEDADTLNVEEGLGLDDAEPLDERSYDEGELSPSMEDDVVAEEELGMAADGELNELATEEDMRRAVENLADVDCEELDDDRIEVNWLALQSPNPG